MGDTDTDIVKLLNLDDKFREKYYVPDLLDPKDELKVIFILESPHTKEVICKYPVAGGSGISMAKTLGLSQESSLGGLVKAHRVKNIGIMNVCPIPMQPKPYCDCDNSDELIEVLKSFGTILGNLGAKNRKDDKTQEAEENLIKDFRERLSKVYQKDILLIPCGKIARYFLKKYSQEIYKSDQTIKDIPHPSRNSWSWKKYTKQIKEMKEKIKRCLG